MMIQIRYEFGYFKDLRELNNEKPQLKREIVSRIKIFSKKPEDTRLNNHMLGGKLKGQWAFSITGDIRIVYRWTGKNKVSFVGIGPHAKVYKRN